LIHLRVEKRSEVVTGQKNQYLSGPMTACLSVNLL
jgi:hypothetical protein